MINIIKGNKRMLIPFSSFKEYYESAGWNVESSNVKNDYSENEYDSDEYDSDEWDSHDEWDEIDNNDKPLEKMNKSELIKKAEELGIDISDCTSNNMIKNKIKQNS